MATFQHALNAVPVIWPTREPARLAALAVTTAEMEQMSPVLTVKTVSFLIQITPQPAEPVALSARRAHPRTSARDAKANTHSIQPPMPVILALWDVPCAAARPNAPPVKISGS